MGNVNYTKYQEQAVYHDNGNAIVSASAGSGKTKVVIDRIIRLITDKGANVNRILAVTFTNLAASEMKEKLKDAIIKRFNLDGVSNEEKIRLKKELDDVNGADISTIHSFCLNVLKRYFYATSLDATFDICDETKAKKLKLEALDTAFEKLYEENSTEFLTALDVFARGRNDRKLRNIVLEFANFVEAETGVSAINELTLNSTNNVTSLLDGFLKEYYQNRIKFIRDKLLEIKPLFIGAPHREIQIKEFENKIQDCINATTYKELIAVLKNAKIYKKNSVNSEDKLLRSYHDKFEKLAEEAVLACDLSDEETLKLSNNVYNEYLSLEYVYNKFNEEYTALKREENLVDFSDLEHYTYKLLKEREDILNEIKNKYEYIFIDEYQDVNGVQEELIKMLSSSNEFMVGDSKQSIYAFRGCNPRYFIDKNNDYLRGNEGNTAIPLDRNFRSAKNIINTVNSVFSRVMTKDFGNYDYSNYKMEYGGLYGEHDGLAVFDLIEEDVEKEKSSKLEGVYSVKKDDAILKSVSDVSATEKLTLKLIKDALGRKYYDVKENKEKEIEYKDIVILMRSLGELGDSLVNYLVKEGVPVSAESKEGIGNYPEIKTLVNFVKLLICAEQDIPLANTLLEFFELTEQDLATIRAFGDNNGENNYSDLLPSKSIESEKSNAKLDRKSSFYDCVKAYSNTPTDLGAKLKYFFNYLEKTRMLSEFSSVGELLTKVISETGYDNRIIASNFGEMKMRRIERFISSAGTSSIYDFANRIEEILEKITVSEASGENTVRVMTMHASKGLEFPYVIIAGADKKFNFSDGEGFFIKDRELGVSLQTINRNDKLIRKNPHYNVVSKKVKEKAVHEEIRVFYVALTRAKYELHVIADKDTVLGEKPYIGSTTCQSQLLDANDAEIRIHKESELVFDSEIGEEIVSGNEISKELSRLIKRNLTLKYNYQKDTVLPVKSSVSKANLQNTDEYYQTIEVFGDSDAEKGTTYHKALELINFYGNVENEVENLIKLGAFTKEEQSILSVDKLKKILSLNVFNEIKDYNHYKELKFYNLVKPESIGYEGEDSEILVQGIIDLVAIKNNKAVLIDYKLSKIANDGDLIRKYKKQMELYTLALENSLKVEVEKIYLVNILQEKCIEIKRELF